MEYIMIGFFMAIGWTLGKYVINIALDMMCDKIRNTEWYRECKRKESNTIDRPGDIKTVKNQIGFR